MSVVNPVPPPSNDPLDSWTQVWDGVIQVQQRWWAEWAEGVQLWTSWWLTPLPSLLQPPAGDTAAPPAPLH